MVPDRERFPFPTPGRTAAALTGLLLAAACAEGRTGPRGGFVERDSAGVALAENSAGTPIPELALAPGPELVVGREGAPDHELYRASAVEQLASGALVVANGGSSELLFYDPEGRFVRRVGGRGEGPGEFRALELQRFPGDSLAVLDRTARRVTVLDSAGRPVRTRPYPSEGEGSLPDGVADCLAPGVAGVMADDRLLVMGWLCIQYLGSAGIRSFRGTSSVVGPEGAREVLTIELPFYLEQGGGPGTSIRTSALPFPPAYSTLAMQDGFLVGVGTDRDIRVYASDGSLRRVIRELEPLPSVTPEHRALARRLREEAGNPLHDDVPFPERFPGWTGLVLDDEGRIWAREFPEPAEERERWWIYAPEGRRLARVLLPARFTLSSVRGGRLFGLSRDPLDVQRLEVHRLTDLPGAGS